MAIKFVDIEPEDKKTKDGATPSSPIPSSPTPPPAKPADPVPAGDRDLLGPVGPKPEPKKRGRKAAPRPPV